MIKTKPDIRFKQELKRVSKSSLNECMQCGTCSVVCSLAPDSKPFPRKEMIWAGWGIKEKLIANPDIWLCHQCGDCTTHCPRNVKPSDVFAGVRQLTYQYYAIPNFFGKLLNKPVWLPLALLIPVVIISCILLMAGTLTIPEGPVNYSKFFPHAWLNSSFTLLTIIFYALGIIGLRTFWRDMKRNNPGISNGGFFKNFMKSFKDIITHKRFNSCDTQKKRKISHLLVFYGFIMLLLVTAYAIIAVVINKYPLPFWNPFKIIGNIAALMLIVGLSMMILGRLFNKKNVGNSSYSDWLFLISMFLLTISGVLVEWARFDNWSIAYHIYFFHLVCVWFIVIYLPFSKFGHLLYRTVAMSFAQSIERK